MFTCQATARAPTPGLLRANRERAQGREESLRALAAEETIASLLDSLTAQRPQQCWKPALRESVTANADKVDRIGLNGPRHRRRAERASARTEAMRFCRQFRARPSMGALRACARPASEHPLRWPLA